jgi:hypothetical protein
MYIWKQKYTTDVFLHGDGISLVVPYSRLYSDPVPEIGFLHAKLLNFSCYRLIAISRNCSSYIFEVLQRHGSDFVVACSV